MRNNATKWRNLLFSVTDMQIDKADYALLYAVSEDEWLAYLLAGDVGMESIMNKPSHGLGVEELAEHFFGFGKMGSLSAQSRNPGLLSPSTSILSASSSCELRTGHRKGIAPCSIA